MSGTTGQVGSSPAQPGERKPKHRLAVLSTKGGNRGGQEIINQIMKRISPCY
jgi:hypothetical protein